MRWIKISSYLLKDTDQVEVNDKSKKLNIIDGSIQSKERDVPEYIQLDNKNKTVKLVRKPKRSNKRRKGYLNTRKNLYILII